jgi:phosphoribosylaminoimidazole carboxylase
LLALRIVAVAKPELLEAMETYLGSLKQEVGQKIEQLENIGWKKFLAKK